MTTASDFAIYRATGRTFVRAMLCTCLLTGAASAAGLDLSGYRGKVVYLDFWASWCGPCKQSFPWLDQLTREYASQKFVVIGVNVDKDHGRAARFLEEIPVGFPIFYERAWCVR